MPSFLNMDEDEFEETLFRLLDNLLTTISSQSGRSGTKTRKQVGRVRADFSTLLMNKGLGIALLTCFRLAADANANLESLAYVRQKLFDEKPVDQITKILVQSAIVYCLATESRIVTKMTFASRDDAEAMMNKMKLAFDTAREIAADAIDSACYQQLTYLAGAITQHLANTARPLPRMIKFSLRAALPALTVSQMIYHEGSRWDELVDENHTVHPAFMQRDLKGLSA